MQYLALIHSKDTEGGTAKLIYTPSLNRWCWKFGDVVTTRRATVAGELTAYMLASWEHASASESQ